MAEHTESRRFATSRTAEPNELLELMTTRARSRPMNDTERDVYLRARKYWDTRFNDIHVPLAYADARDLLQAHPQADPAVIIPAILLHDVGWKSISESEQHKAFGIRIEDEGLRRLHETEGARIARSILGELEFDPRRREAIVAIIDGHDTRLEALSLEDSLVKDADKLWRFTAAGIDLDHRRFKVPYDAFVARLADQVDRWLFSDCAKALARGRLDRARRARSSAGDVG